MEERSAVTKRQHTATFDAMNRMLTDVGGESQTTTFGYDSNSNITKITDPLSHVTNNTYDALNRLSTSKDAELNLVTIHLRRARPASDRQRRQEQHDHLRL